MREFLTNEQLLRILAALRAPREAQAPDLQAASSTDAPEPWELPELGLRIWLIPYPTSTRLYLTGKEVWRNALVQCEWSLYKETEPGNETPETLHIFLRMPTESFGGVYQRQVDIPNQLRSRPDLARIVPKYADPAVFEQRWRSALVKPSLEELHEWIEAHRDDFPPRHRQTWLDMPAKLAAEP